MKNVTVNSEKVILDADLFKVVEYDLTFSGEVHRVYKSVKRDNSVSVFPVEGDYIYLIRQYRYLIEQETIEAVAGMIDKKETSFDAAKRELKEELGFTAKSWKDILTYQSAASIISYQHSLFLAKNLQKGQVSLDETENITILKMTIEEAVNGVMTGKINTAGSMMGILLIDKMRKEGVL